MTDLHLVGDWTTHLKNMLIKLEIFPKLWLVVKIQKYLKPPPRYLFNIQVFQNFSYKMGPVSSCKSGYHCLKGL